MARGFFTPLLTPRRTARDGQFRRAASGPGTGGSGCRNRPSPHLAELSVVVADFAAPPTNNTAERSLCHLVTARKINGGARSQAGTATRMTLATLFGAWRLQGLNPLTRRRALLAQPQC